MVSMSSGESELGEAIPAAFVLASMGVKLGLTALELRASEVSAIVSDAGPPLLVPISVPLLEQAVTRTGSATTWSAAIFRMIEPPGRKTCGVGRVVAARDALVEASNVSAETVSRIAGNNFSPPW